MARAVPDAEHVWPLSSLQEGLHFESTYDTSGRDPYTATWVIALDRPLDGATLRRALAAMLGRRPALRASFVHEELPQTLQVVARRVEVPLDEVQLPAGDEDAPWSGSSRTTRGHASISRAGRSCAARSPAPATGASGSC